MGNSESRGSSGTSDSPQIGKKTFKDFLEATRKCYEQQLRVSNTLLELSDELDKLDRDVVKTNIALASASVALTATGIGLSFLTFGCSLVLTAVGVGLGTAAGVSGVAASLVKKILKNKKMKEANKAIQEYAEAVIEYAPLLQKFCDSLATKEERERLHAVLTDSSNPTESVTFRSVPEEACEACSKGHSIVMTSSRVQQVLGIPEVGGGTPHAAAKMSLSAVSDASTLAGQILSKMTPLAKAVSIGGHALAGVGLIIDIGTIIHQSLKLHEKKPSEVAQLLRAIAGAFKE